MSAQRSEYMQLQDDYVRTGEAVTLDVKPASPMERLTAAFMDATCYIGLVVIMVDVATRSLRVASDSLSRVLQVLILASLMFIIPLTVEVATGGRSLGKWAMNLRVVRDDGGARRCRYPRELALPRRTRFRVRAAQRKGQTPG